jgi:hypothetical protein
MANETESAYTAGIIDGEGCIRLQRKTFGLDVSVGNTDLNLLIWLKEVWGGKIYLNGVRAKRPTGNNKPFFHWRICGAMAFPFLEQIVPFLVIKKDRAMKALELREVYGRKNNYLPGFNESMRAKRIEIQRALAEMNQRGTSAVN